MYTHWFDKAEAELEDALRNGEITDEEFRKEMRNLQDELQGQAEEAAEQAYNDFMGNW